MNQRLQVLPIDTVLQTEVNNWHHLGGNSWEHSFGGVPPVTKLTVSANEKAEILRLLYKEGMTYAHIYPSYDNVVKTLQDVAQANVATQRVIVKKVE